MTKTKKSFVGLFLRGIAMGAADVVPGVSGGTIAFITGIYEELLETISGFKWSLVTVLRKEGFKAFWQKANLSFLLSLLSGIFVSIISLAKLITWLLVEHPILVWSFFFGLVIASIFLVAKSINKWSFSTILSIIIGTATAYYVTIITPTTGSTNLLYILLSGMLAICAMILPGISGSFILVLLGGYMTILGAITNLLSALKSGNWNEFFTNGILLAVFALGCIIGLLAFSRLLNYLFKKAHNITIAILTGFLIGSLNKIWPWKIVDEYFIKHPGEINEEKIPLVEHNVWPNTYTNELGIDHQLGFSICLLCAGFLLIFFLEKLGSKKSVKSQ